MHKDFFFLNFSGFVPQSPEGMEVKLVGSSENNITMTVNPEPVVKITT